jgi:hypothetical protein
VKAFADHCGVIDQSLKAIDEKQNKSRTTTHTTTTPNAAAETAATAATALDATAIPTFTRQPQMLDTKRANLR